MLAVINKLDAKISDVQSRKSKGLVTREELYGFVSLVERLRRAVVGFTGAEVERAVLLPDTTKRLYPDTTRQIYTGPYTQISFDGRGYKIERVSRKLEDKPTHTEATVEISYLTETSVNLGRIIDFLKCEADWRKSNIELVVILPSEWFPELVGEKQSLRFSIVVPLEHLSGRSV